VMKMYCIVAAESGAAEIIVKNLRKIYSDWQFELCSDAKTLMQHKLDRPDVVVVSRFLPGDDPFTLLKNLTLVFPTSHIVLLAGKLDEQARVYIRAAEKLGLENIVIGKLPGDKPYDIFVAFRAPKNPEKDDYYNMDDAAEVDNDGGEDYYSYPGAEEEFESTGIAAVEKEDQNEERDVRAALEAVAGVNDANLIKDKLQEIIKMLEYEKAGEGETPLQRMSPVSSADMHTGICVLPAANKGGVGKTTVAVTLAVALSRAGVSTVLTDFDLGAPDIANALGIKGVPGIEALAGRLVRENVLRDVIVQHNGLDVLPGPQDKTIPAFKQGQLMEIVNVLTRMYSVVIGDTPPEYWTKPWLTELFSRADYVLAVVDQSILSERDTANYAPYLLSMGVTPEKIGIVLNRFSPKLHNPRTVEKIFCNGFKKEIKNLPKVVAVIPEDWNAHVMKGYKGEVVGLDDVYSQWHRLAEKIAGMAGYGYKREEKKKMKTIKELLFKRFR